MLQGEPGGRPVEAVLEHSVMTTVNWSEVVQKVIARGLDATGLGADLGALGLGILPFDAGDAEHAARLWAKTRAAGLSLGDRACLAVAHRLDLPAVTVDRAWADLDLDVEIQVWR